MDFRPRIEHEIDDLRVRRTWTGKLVMQLRRKCRKPILTQPPGLKVEWEEDGIGPWKDANGNDASEIAEVVAALSCNPDNYGDDMNADRIDYYANQLRGVSVSDLGRKAREILRDVVEEAKASEREACANTCKVRRDLEETKGRIEGANIADICMSEIQLRHNA